MYSFLKNFKRWEAPLLLVFVFSLSACNSDTEEVQRLSSRIAELESISEQKIAEANAKLEEAQMKMEAADQKVREAEAAKAQLELQRPDPQQEAIQTLEAKIQTLEAELSEQKKTHQDYVEKYRTSAVGRKLDSVTTVDGKEYTDVTLKEIDNLSVTLTHSAGIVRLAYSRLDPVWGEEFGFSEEAAKEQLIAEQKAYEERKRYLAEQDELASQVLAEQQQQMAEYDKVRQAKLRADEIAMLNLEINKAENKISILRDEIREREWRSVAGAQINASAARVPQLKAEVLRLENYITTAEARIDYLESLDKK